MLQRYRLDGFFSWFLSGLKYFMQERFEERKKRREDFEPAENSDNVESDNGQITTHFELKLS